VSTRVPHDSDDATSGGRLDQSHLLDLIRLRSGQLYDCQPCIDHCLRELHSGDESEDKIDELPRWRSSDHFAPAEKAALALCEAVCENPDVDALGSVLHAAHAYFSDQEVSRLVLCILAVDDLNKLCAPA
jgi:alkylhydroperoxidase family enzyme